MRRAHATGPAFETAPPRVGQCCIASKALVLGAAAESAVRRPEQ